MLIIPVFVNPISVLANSEEYNVVADWHLNEDSIVSGSISGGDLVFRDQTGNGSNLEMQFI